MADSSEYIQMVRNRSSNKDESVRGGLHQAVNIGEPAVEVLITSLNNPDSVVRLRASWALGCGSGMFVR